MTDNRLYMVVGLPDTGKTTYLAALWHSVDVASRPGTLSLERLEGDRTYLNEIAGAWLGGRRVPRTHLSSEQIVRMKLKADGKSIGEFAFPDLAGEGFVLHLESRRWPQTFDQQVRGCDGMLLFIHPDRVRKPTRIDHADQLVEAIGGDECEADSTEQPKPWSAKDGPTQVQLVDLLQCFIFRRDPDTRLRLAVIVSAWDLLKDHELTPPEWLSKELPMLTQFLAANGDRITHTVFGVSAQGGALEQAADLLKLDPAERAIVVGEDVSDKHDLSAPIRWTAEVK